MHPSRPRVRRSGFTLIELLVVIGIIGVLVGLLLPGLAYARFRSKVTTCTSNYRQWAIAVNLYAGEDGKGRLPSFPLPVDRMAQYGSIEPWFVALEMITNMAPQGVTAPMWFCPARPARFKAHADNFRALRGRELTTPADLVDEFVNVQRGAFGAGDLFWWVPRRLGDSSLEFPDPKLMKTRVPDPWPSRLDDPTVSTMPFISDWTVGQWADAHRTMELTGGGHALAAYVPTTIRSSNSGFADGHVETRPRKQLQWQADGKQGWTYVY